MTQTNIIIIAVIITALIIGGGVYLWMSPKTTTTQPATQVSPTGEQGQEGQEIEQPSAQEEAQVDPYAGWKMYRNTKYGFEIKYPGNLSLANDYYDCYDDTGKKIELRGGISAWFVPIGTKIPCGGFDYFPVLGIDFLDRSIDLSEVAAGVKNDDPNGVVIYENFLGNEAVKYSYLSPVNGVTTEAGITFNHGESGYRIYWIKDSKNEKETNQILSTFKFAK